MCMRWHRASNSVLPLWHRARYLICSAVRARTCQAGGSWVVADAHTSLLPEVGTMKAASSNVETVFSGAGQLPPKLYAEILSNYTVLHHNLKYTWLDPSGL